MGTRLKWAMGICVALVIGVGIGLVVKTDGLVAAVRDALAQAKPASGDAHGHDHGSGEASNEHPDHVDLTDEAQKTLGVQLGKASLGTYTRHLHLPATVAEKPGHSARTIATRVQGIIERVYCSPGELVRPGDRLFDIKLAGDAFVTAQANLLETMQQIETTKRELERVSELAQQGTVSGKQKIQLEYELKKLDSQRSLRQQELVVRGLTAEQVVSVVKTGKLLDELTIFVPKREVPTNTKKSDIVPTSANHLNITDGDADGRDDFFTVESIDVHPGKSIAPGDALAHLAWHDRLYVEGHAFERDLTAIANVIETKLPVSVEFGSHGDPLLMEGLRIRYLDNHVDAEAGTFRFYIEFQNQILQDSRDEAGLVYRSWRFKPGQRVHVRVPIDEISGHFVLPLAAVVQEGVNAYIFRVAAHDHSKDGGHGHDHDHGHDHSGLEMNQVPVSIVTQDTKQVVVASGGDLKVGDRIAMNAAYQLRLALRSGSGGGHAHGHEH